MLMDSPVQILLDANEAHQRLCVVEQERHQFAFKIQRLEEKRDAAVLQLTSARADYAAVQDQLTSLEAQCESLDRQHEQLSRALNAGKVGNYEQGLSQKNQLKESISKSEDAILEILDTIDTYPTQIENLEEHIEHLEQSLRETHSARDDREEILKAQEAVAVDEMKAHVNRLPEVEQRRFWAVRQKHTKLVYPLVGNACGQCHVAIALKQVSLILQGISIYRCSKCGVFVLKSDLLQSDS